MEQNPKRTPEPIPINKPEIGATERIGLIDRMRNLVVNKERSYAIRFGPDYCPEEGFFLSAAFCQRELDRAKSILEESGESVHAKMMPFEEHEADMGALEIDTNGRRFAIPRDEFLKLEGYYQDIYIYSGVVTVLEQKNWPSWLKAQMDSANDGQYLPDSLRKLSPKTIEALRNISNNSLIYRTRELAIYLKLGEPTPKSEKINVAPVDIDKVLDDFGLADVNELALILREIGLEMISTSNRIADQDQPYPNFNDQTEVDSLLEAINKFRKRKSPKQNWST